MIAHILAGIGVLALVAGGVAGIANEIVANFGTCGPGEIERRRRWQILLGLIAPGMALSLIAMAIAGGL